MEKKKIINRVKFLVVVAIIAAFVWFLVISPMMTFHRNEEKLENAAKRYFELNKEKLPTGERMKTLSLQELYHDSYLQGDIYAPYTKKVCSVTDSWVKVRRENNEFKYYVYLDCGILKSSIDHEGPTIKLNGKSEMSLGVGDKYNDPGVKSVIDNSDGKLEVSDVTIKGSVDTSKVGTYELQYIAFDKLSNKSTVTRTVKVVKMIKNVVKKDLASTSNYVGNPNNNYVRLSNMMFRIFGLDDKDNIILVAEEDVANVNHTKLDKWLEEYYYEHLNSKTKKMIVKSKFCNQQLDEGTLETSQCNSYTKEKNVYIPSVVEVNKAQAGNDNFMKTFTMSWVANGKSSREAYVTRNQFFGEERGKSFLPYDSTFNYGVRPMFVIKGNSLITGGNGTQSDPYVFGDSKVGRSGSPIGERATGEYIEESGVLYRIVEPLDDGTVKVISNSTLGSSLIDKVTVYVNPTTSGKIEYNFKKSTSMGYYINNNISQYVDTSNFVNHVVEVPVYKNKLIYGEEKKVEKYKAKLSAPNMYEMFSAQSVSLINEDSRSYWLINASDAKNTAGVITDIGVPLNEEVPLYNRYGIRVVAYVKSSAVITSGNGTFNSPYKIK